MKTNELRIGNYIQYPGLKNPIRVSIIDTTETNTQTKAQPILLTEEWLLKFGFIKLGILRYFYISSENTNIKISHDLEMISWNNSPLRGVTIKHIHQLQNLYFALTGEELEIK